MNGFIKTPSQIVNNKPQSISFNSPRKNIYLFYLRERERGCLLPINHLDRLL